MNTSGGQTYLIASQISVTEKQGRYRLQPTNPTATKLNDDYGHLLAGSSD